MKKIKISKASLMIQGTTSDAGKSAIATGLCRTLVRRGYHVAPFKPQNMALNSAVTIDGGEIGRSQAVQALACGIEPHTDMNPVLLKPSSDTGSQIIIRGKIRTHLNAKDYHAYKPKIMQEVLLSYRNLARRHEMIIIEGAGSPAEINLREHDIANMGFAEAIDCPVLLIADIERGGVFAHLVGTLALLSQSERNRVKGLIINRFRGDVALLQPGIDWLEQKTGKPVLGVIPYLKDLHLEAEDSLNLHHHSQKKNAVIKIIVPRLARMSNHTDFEPLQLHPQVEIQFIPPSQTPPPCDLIILAGSKNVRSDLRILKQHHWQSHLKRHLRYGGKLIGICGGYQMLGTHIHDPKGTEDIAGTEVGLNLLDFSTTLQSEKQLKNITGRLQIPNYPTISGYEIHTGISTGKALQQPAILLNTVHKTQQEGVISTDQQILGTYCHGLFDQQQACNTLLQWIGLQQANTPDYQQLKQQGINQLADAMEQYLDMKRIMHLLTLGTC